MMPGCGLVALLSVSALFGATDAEMEAHAAALQAKIFTIDTHIDTPTASLRHDIR